MSSPNMSSPKTSSSKDLTQEFANLLCIGGFHVLAVVAYFAIVTTLFPTSVSGPETLHVWGAIVSALAVAFSGVGLTEMLDGGWTHSRSIPWVGGCLAAVTSCVLALLWCILFRTTSLWWMAGWGMVYYWIGFVLEWRLGYWFQLAQIMVRRRESEGYQLPTHNAHNIGNQDKYPGGTFQVSGSNPFDFPD